MTISTHNDFVMISANNVRIIVFRIWIDCVLKHWNNNNSSKVTKTPFCQMVGLLYLLVKLNDWESPYWQNCSCFFEDALTELVNHYAK